MSRPVCANFLAVRWPDSHRGVPLSQETSPVNLFPILFNELLSIELPTWPYRPYE